MFRADRSEEGRICLLGLEGSLSSSDLVNLSERLRGLAARGVLRVVVDLRAVRYASAQALGVLVTFLVELRRRGGDLALLGCPGHLRELFALCGLDEIFQFLEPPEDGSQDG